MRRLINLKLTSMLSYLKLFVSYTYYFFTWFVKYEMMKNNYEKMKKKKKSSLVTTTVEFENLYEQRSIIKLAVNIDIINSQF
jgi:hypothetical protein